MTIVLCFFGGLCTTGRMYTIIHVHVGTVSEQSGILTADCLELLHRGSRVTIADGHHAGLPRVLTTEHFALSRIADPVSIVGGHYAALSRTSPQTVSSCHES